MRDFEGIFTGDLKPGYAMETESTSFFVIVITFAYFWTCYCLFGRVFPGQYKQQNSATFIWLWITVLLCMIVGYPIGWGSYPVTWYKFEERMPDVRVEIAARLLLSLFLVGYIYDIALMGLNDGLLTTYVHHFVFIFLVAWVDHRWSTGTIFIAQVMAFFTAIEGIIRGAGIMLWRDMRANPQKRTLRRYWWYRQSAIWSAATRIVSLFAVIATLLVVSDGISLSDVLLWIIAKCAWTGVDLFHSFVMLTIINKKVLPPELEKQTEGDDSTANRLKSLCGGGNEDPEDSTDTAAEVAEEKRTNSSDSEKRGQPTEVELEPAEKPAQANFKAEAGAVTLDKKGIPLSVCI